MGPTWGRQDPMNFAIWEIPIVGVRRTVLKPFIYVSPISRSVHLAFQYATTKLPLV